MKRRNFLQQAAILTGAGFLPSVSNAFSSNSATAGTLLLGARTGISANALPKWQGFNLLDFFSPDRGPEKYKTLGNHLQWMSDWGFNFVRVPIAYPYYLKFDRSKPITAEEVYQLDEQRINEIEQLVNMANKYKLHVSLNLHRAPGYCINAGFREPYHLWTDKAAQDAFYFHWNMWAKRFKNKSASQISFDLVNEPSMKKDLNDQHSPSGPVPGEYYRKIAIGALDAIRKENPAHLVIADGNQVGNVVIPEIEDLPIAQSCRGYFPSAISHYKAPWANKEPEKNPTPVWPGKIGDQEFNRASLEAYYKPWIDLKNKGIGVHCGECGCWNKTPHKVFLAWFNDVIDILNSHQIGYGVWNFIGDFGILDSGRSDVNYTSFNGHKLDKELLTMLQRYHT
jgi:endoglucanase